MEGHIDQQQAYLITVVNKAFWVNGYGGVSVGGNKLVLLTLPTQLRALQAMLTFLSVWRSSLLHKRNSVHEEFF